MDFFFYTQNDAIPEWTGGKAFGLYQLHKLGFRVPEFYVFPAQSLDQVIAKLNAWMSQVNPATNSLWAVRSSASVEDGKEKSFAGLFSSVINCTPSQLPEAFAKVFRSFDTTISSGYHAAQKPEGNIVLQKMMNGAVSGVGFSANPINYESNNPLINMVPGLGTGLVSGKEYAFMLEILPNKESYILSDAEMFEGEIFSNGLKRISVSKNELHLSIKPFFEELRNGLLLLEETNGFPVDVEFTIAENQLYWLQMRPVTQFIPKENFSVWDNANVSNNYPGLVLPFTSSFVKYAYTIAYRNMLVFLGARKAFFETNERSLENLIGSIHGSLYYNLTNWQQVLYQMPFGNKTSKLIAKTFGAEEARFEKPRHKASTFLHLRFLFNLIKGVLFFSYFKNKYLNIYDRTKNAFNSECLEERSHEALINTFNNLETTLTRYWIPPMLNGFYTMISYNGMRAVLSRSSLHSAYPNLLNDALSNSNEKVISVEIVRNLQVILKAIYEAPDAKRIIMDSSSQVAMQFLNEHYPEILSKINSYIEQYGERCEEGELKMETVNYREDNNLFIDFLRNNLKTYVPLQINDSILNYKKIIRNHYRLNFLKRWLLIAGIGYTIKRVRDRENFRFIRTKSFHLVRQVFREIGNRLYSEGFIEKPRDSLYLNLDEVCNPEMKNEYFDIIRDRKKMYDSYRLMVHADRYYENEEQFYPVQSKKINTGEALHGNGCSSGLMEGEVVIVTESNVHTVDATNKILVAKYFEPGWIGLFTRAGGLISERGSLLSHTAILCREMKIPAIVGVKHCLQHLQNGERILMDGATGRIEKLK